MPTSFQSSSENGDIHQSFHIGWVRGTKYEVSRLRILGRNLNWFTVSVPIATSETTAFISYSTRLVKLNLFQKPHFSRLYLPKFYDDFLSFGVFNPNRVSNRPNSIKLVKWGQSETLSWGTNTKKQKIFSKLWKIKSWRMRLLKKIQL